MEQFNFDLHMRHDVLSWLWLKPYDPWTRAHLALVVGSFVASTVGVIAVLLTSTHGIILSRHILRPALRHGTLGALLCYPYLLLLKVMYSKTQKKVGLIAILLAKILLI